MIILKLGGSVITQKAKKGQFRKKIMDNLAKQINRANQEIILVHGAGSFGHIPAEKYKLNEGYLHERQIHGFSLTHGMVQKLNSLVLDSLQHYGIPAVSLPPHTILTLDNHKLIDLNVNLFEQYLYNKFVPVTFGDVVLDKKLTFSICSGDLLVQALTTYFRPEKAIFAIDEDGLYTSNPKINKNAEFIRSTTLQELEQYQTPADNHADVTRGMQGKIDTIKKISRSGINIVLVNGNKPDRLYNILTGKDDKCTIIHGGK
jgi:isopentenyl phosphate kinase